jgi:hypothetical protein
MLESFEVILPVLSRFCDLVQWPKARIKISSTTGQDDKDFSKMVSIYYAFESRLG